ncbi:GTPase-activating protein, putative [Babesia caballi]|uniref:GTPase-activating protein, putative n=1 Tax=Babesia caballi TaxID=5871 RepID=A0AAV4LXK0_BABCB|nr:GTPase-activating protein, putative [Babesia caballi]
MEETDDVAYPVTYDEEGYCGVTLDDFNRIFALCGPSDDDESYTGTADGMRSPDASRLRGNMVAMHRLASTVASTHIGFGNMRRVVWGYLLGAFTAVDLDQLVAVIERNRQRYWELVAKHRNQGLENMQQLNPQIFHPLAPVERNPWELSQRLRELLDEIWQDVERTYQERSLFTSDRVRKTLQNVLYVWSREHDYISYRQGMNELLAVVYIACYRDQVRGAEADSSSHFAVICSSDMRDLEADAYTLFDTLMCPEMQLMFDNSAGRMPLVRNSRNSSVNLAKLASHSSRSKIDAHNSFIARTKFVYSRILKAYDLPLYNHLQNMEVEPHVFLMRWIRLIFSREFNVNETLHLWDAVFSDHFLTTVDCRDPPEFQYEIIDFFAVAMMSYVRLNLLENDINYCLQRLFKFPPIEDISHLIAKAHKIRIQFYKRASDQPGTAYASGGSGLTITSAQSAEEGDLQANSNASSRTELSVGATPNTPYMSLESMEGNGAASTSQSPPSLSAHQVDALRRSLEGVASGVYRLFEKAFVLGRPGPHVYTRSPLGGSPRRRTGLSVRSLKHANGQCVNFTRRGRRTMRLLPLCLIAATLVGLGGANCLSYEPEYALDKSELSSEYSVRILKPGIPGSRVVEQGDRVKVLLRSFSPAVQKHISGFAQQTFEVGKHPVTPLNEAIVNMRIDEIR